MSNFFELSADSRRTVYEQVSIKLGVDAKAVEKDVWVTSVLQSVFSLPYADKLVFKGGTSLSKIWKLIQRFSEDIDLAIDRSVFGFDGDLTKRQLKKLRKASSVFVKEDFVKDLTAIFQKNGLIDYCTITPDPDGEGDATYPEPRQVHIAYTSVFDTDSLTYLRPEVVLEIGARSLIEPTTRARVKSLVSDNTTIDTSMTDVDIVAAIPKKTFLEKAFLLHELFTTDGCRVANRKSRHLYDLEKMMHEPFVQDAIHDDDLWETIRHHREVFTPIKDVDYTPDIRKRLVLLPPDDVIDVWKEDYEAMQDTMIFEESLSFEQLLSRIEEIQSYFRSI